MSLYSFFFILFLVVVALLYYASPRRWQWLILLLASLVFYVTYSYVFALLLIFIILVNYLLGLSMERTVDGRGGLLLWLGVIFNIGLLAFYKYLAPLLDSGIFFNQETVLSDLLVMPIGLSFHALQAVSYLVEVRQGKSAAERHIGIFSLSILFFPRVLSGPIERPAFMEQFKTEKQFDYKNITDGMKIMAWGWFKKMFIAERLVVVVNDVYSDPTKQHGVGLIFATLMFTLVLYADFSGYTDIVIGAARIFGINLTQNFNHPFSARSISEFWQRWHISLSNWLRDYIFFPLRRFLLRKSRGRFAFLAVVIPPLITMLVSGLWHGTGWTFIVWGGLHGIYLLFFQLTDNTWQKIGHFIRLDRFPRLLISIQQTITFILLALSLIFFRADNLRDAYFILTHLFNRIPAYVIVNGRNLARSLIGLDWSAFVQALKPTLIPLTLNTDFRSFLILVALGVLIVIERTRFDLLNLSSKSTAVRWAFYFIFLVVCLLFSVPSIQNKGFIYFRF